MTNSYKEENMRGNLFHHSGITDASPRRKGYIVINNVRYWIASWDKKDKKGNTYWTLVATPTEHEEPHSTTENQSDDASA